MPSHPIPKDLPVGDPHNFGQRVLQLESNKFYKPRSVHWEQLFLDDSYPLRSWLCAAVDRPNFPSISNMIPALHFSGVSHDKIGRGLVSAMPKTKAADVVIEESEAFMIGSIIGLLTWFGVTDLHIHNMRLGRDPGENFVFAPLDVECIFNDLILPSQTLLLPSKDISRDLCGLTTLANMMERSNRVTIPALITGYYESIVKLEQEKLQIGLMLSALGSEFPIRILIRATREYDLYLKQAVEPSIKFSESERIQLERGDIPYFFRYQNQADVMLWQTEEKTQIAELPDLHERPLEYLTHSPLEGLLGKRRTQLARAGMLQLARFFDPNENCVLNFCEISIFYRDDVITVKRDNKDEFGCKRTSAI